MASGESTMKNEKQGLFKKCLFALAIFLIGILFASPVQAAEFNEVTRLAALAKVWGALKYYHPEVVKGRIDWDAALISRIGEASAANSIEHFNLVLDDLIRRAGDINVLFSPRPVPGITELEPVFSWMNDRTHFTWYTRFKLHHLIDPIDRPAIHDIYYCFYHFDKGNLNFSREKIYDASQFPEQNLRLLSLFRYWNIIHFFFPYKHLMDRDWEEVLMEFIPRFRDAGSALDYHMAVLELVAAINDTHARTLSAIIDEFWGLYGPPFDVMRVDGKTVVTRIYDHLPASAGTLQVGDVIVRADGVDVETLRAEKARYISDSNEEALHRDLGQRIFRGATPSLRLDVIRDGRDAAVEVIRYHIEDYAPPPDILPVWNILPGNIGYVNMGLLKVAHVPDMMEQLKETRAIIFDIRNYPKGTLYALGLHLNPNPKAFVKLTYPDLKRPGLFQWKGPLYVGPSDNPNHYKGHVVILINETTQSQAEFTVMALQTAPLAKVIGSQTAGADGNVSMMSLPGGIRTAFTGLGVYYPDGRETQRIGIVPDIPARPTIAGIRSGRDEVLEKALEYIYLSDQ